MEKGRFAIIIPVYNHEQRVTDVARNALKLGYPVFVVDDGSTDATRDRVKEMAGVTVLRHETNRGKGAAIKTGFAAAAPAADWAITIDADGQHDPDNALGLVHAIPEAAFPPDRRPIMIGMRSNMVGDDVPWTSRFGRKFSNFWVRAAGGPAVKDSQSGFRIYPLPQCMKMRTRANRFQFEVEILAKAGWLGIPVIEAPVSVTYTPGMERVSHFRPFVDFWRNGGTFMRLMIQRLLIPRFIRRKMAYKK